MIVYRSTATYLDRDGNVVPRAASTMKEQFASTLRSDVTAWEDTKRAYTRQNQASALIYDGDSLLAVDVSFVFEEITFATSV